MCWQTRGKCINAEWQLVGKNRNEVANEWQMVKRGWQTGGKSKNHVKYAGFMLANKWQNVSLMTPL
ncbi:hypothetical protein EP56_01785 [Listeriaceae bacterium FSL A5-0209]|nr:hypothetical protein EP56_01785 [Listeriaceae bacterium FSL A5-0209]